MKYRLLDLLACPVCGGEFRLRATEEQKGERSSVSKVPCRRRCGLEETVHPGASNLTKVAPEDCADCYGREILEGTLFCAAGHSFPIRRGVLRATDPKNAGGAQEIDCFRETLERQKRVKATFDREWGMVDAEREIYGHSREGEKEDFFRRLCVNAEFLKDKLVLDVGSGIGRLAMELSRVASEVIGVELSSGVDTAWEQSRSHPGVHFIQGDLYRLPFRTRAFDYVYSKGVLQYVYDPREAFRQICRFVRPGGGLSITLYPPISRPFRLVNRIVRSVTLRLPLRTVSVLSILGVPFLSLFWDMSGFQKRKISLGDRRHMIFNWLVSDHQNFHAPREVLSWYREEGFTDLRYSSLPVGIYGRWEGHEA